MLVLGVIGGFGHGVIRPLFIMTFGSLINSLSVSSLDADPAAAFANFNSFVVTLVYLAIAGFVGGYLRNAMFVHVGYIQTDRIRMEYLTALFRQEIGWVDSKRAGELTTKLARYWLLLLFLLFRTESSIAFTG